MRFTADFFCVLQIGIGGSLAAPPLPHHRTCGSAYGGSVTWAGEGRGFVSPFPMRLRRSQVPFGLHPIRPWQAPPKRIGWRMAFHESRVLLSTITVRAFVRFRTTMPSADFC